MNQLKTIALPAALAYLGIRLVEMVLGDKAKGVIGAVAGVAGAAAGIMLSSSVAGAVGAPKLKA